MVRSMTAFGRARGERGGRGVLVEIKSVNNRYLDCTVKVPHMFSFLEEKIKSYISAKGISRGKVDVFVRIDVLEQDGIEIKLDAEYTRSYLDALKRLSEEFSLPNDITTMSVARNSAVFSVKSAEEDMEKEWQNVLPTLDEALDMFIAAREREGERLKQDIIAKRQNIEAITKLIAPLSEADAKQQYEKMRARIEQLVGDVQLDESRLITECAIYADKIAIDEELVRLGSHFREFDRYVESKEPIGRKLDFLLQEMNRETNTIGSKACDSEIAKYVIEIKAELEKIREQIQNIE